MKLLLLSLTGAAAVLAACGGGELPLARPSPTGPSPTVRQPTATATPTQVLTHEPDFREAEEAVAETLTSGGGSTTCLAELLQTLSIVADNAPSCVRADMDDDGEDEYLVRLIAPDPWGYAFPDSFIGNIVIFAKTDGVFRAAFRFYDPVTRGGIRDMTFVKPVILGVEDYNGDGRLEAALTSSMCGAHTCHLTLYLFAFQGNQYVSIVRPSTEGRESSISAPITENQIRFEDKDGDGVAELLFRQGLIQSVGAGPQREATLTYRWDGQMYTYSETEYDVSNLRYFKVRDADDAFAAGDYGRAIELYRVAIDNPELQEVQYFGSREELLAYSEFRIGLAYLKLGEITFASEAIEGVIAKYPVSLQGKAAVAFRNATDIAQAGMTGDLSAGCQAVTAFARDNLDRFREVWDYGYANREFQPEALCPF